MSILGLDLGATKLAAAIFSEEGERKYVKTTPLDNRKGAEVAELVCIEYSHMLEIANSLNERIIAVGVSVPGISRKETGTVWAPNIPGWDDFPLLEALQAVNPGAPVTIDSDRACYILGETWQGNAQGCSNAVFLAIGSGIGAGILSEGEILRGSHDIAGCVGWMALTGDFNDEYRRYGCFEYYASGDGIGRMARRYVTENKGYSGILSEKEVSEITSHDVFGAFGKEDPIAVRVLRECISFWGMAAANLISLLNPEKIIFGGGVFGPAAMFIPDITLETARWAQPIGMKQVTIEVSALGGEAGVYGAGYLALNSL